jgi:hypothetical protein
MRSAIEDAIKLLAEKINASVSPDEALKFTQAALNLAHTDATMEATRRENMK